LAFSFSLFSFLYDNDIAIRCILSLFYLRFFPYVVHAVMYVHAGIYDSRELPVAYHVIVLLLFLSSSLNPGLYLLRMSDIRIGVKKNIILKQLKENLG